MFEENLFKTYLKRKVKFTTSNFVKFLITGTVAFSLTACGGGGGGSSSSGGSNTNQKPIVENTENISKEFEIENGNFTNKGQITLTENKKDSVVGILGKNSDITNNSLIKIKDEESSRIFFSSENGKDILDLLQKYGKSFAIFGEKGNILNTKEGNINITGNDVIGIVGLYSNITNEGKIFTTDNIQDTKNAVGIMTMGGNVENNGDITLISYDGTGIIAYNNGKFDDFEINSGKRISIINNGNITVNGEESRGIVAEGADIDVINKGKLSLNGIDVDGIVVKGDNISILNDINGKIEITNKEKKELKDFEHISGINIKEGTGNVVTNKGNINVSIENEGKFIASGIYAKEKTSNTKIINEGNITIKNTIKKDLTDEDIPIEGYLTDFSYGINSNDKVVNEKNGTINLSGTTVGIKAQNIVNNGNINIKGINIDSTIPNQSKDKAPIGVIVSEKDNIAINNGNINLENSAQAMAGFNQSQIINGEEGIINIKNGFEASALNGENSTVINKGIINLSGSSVTGIEISNGIAENNGKININGNKNSYGIYGEEEGIVTNGKNGIIDVNGNESFGILVTEEKAKTENEKVSTAYNKNIINVNGNNSFGIATQTYEEKIKEQIGARAENSENAIINVKGKDSVALDGFNGDLVNKGNINLLNDNGIGIKISGTGFGDNYNVIDIKGNNSFGMLALNKGTVTNENGGIINVEGNSSFGMSALDEGTAINEGKIELNNNTSGIYVRGNSVATNMNIISGVGDNITGMKAETNNKYSSSKVINDEDSLIQIKGNDTEGMVADGNKDSQAINKGIITIVGKESYGMIAKRGGTVINEQTGVINVTGEGTYGMGAKGNGSQAINNGTINVGKESSGGMLAQDFGYIENNGIINIDKSHNISSEENAKKFALQAITNGQIKNTGTINYDEDIVIKTDNSSSYIIGTTKDGSYGKINAENISLDSNIKVSTEIVKGSYKDSYSFDNVFSGKTNIGDNYQISSTSILYDVSSEIDKDGNFDAKLVRNKNSVSDFSDKNFVQVGEVFDKLFTDEEYRNSLSERDKELVEKVFDETHSKGSINKAVKEVAGYEYSNIARQIFDIKDMFKSYDNNTISTLDNYNFNFNFIGSYNDVDSKHGIVGYDSKVTGITGAIKLSNSLYGVIGYGYSDIDYDNNSDGNIETIHAGIYKDMKVELGNIRLGVFGEYNFHETDRTIINEKEKSDFDSYLIGTEAEISKKYGDSLYVKPTLSLDISYGKYEDFTEENYNLKVKGQDYLSVVPALEIKVGKSLEIFEIYSGIKYSYELGNMNKSQDRIIFNKFITEVENDNIENAQTSINLGATLEFNNISVNTEIGKELGRRDEEYIRAGFSYTF